MVSNFNILILTAIVEDGSFKKSSIRANMAIGKPIGGYLSTAIGYAISSNPLEGFQDFSDLDCLDAFQGNRQISLDTDSSELDISSPLVCVYNIDQSIPSSDVAFSLLFSWEQQPNQIQADDIARRVFGLIKEKSSFKTPQIIASSQERHWLTSSAVIGLKRFFYKASDEIAKKLSANPNRREEGLTDELVYGIFSNSQNQEFLNSLISPSGVEIKLECDESGAAESVLGCDLGMCLTVRSKGLFNRRAILLQAKRLHPCPDNFSSFSHYGDLLESHGIEQSRKMLAITPCSYFLLYNPSDLLNYLNVHGDEIQISTSLDYSTDGICILPASVMEGMNQSRWQNVVDLHPFTCSFVKFMVDDFIQGKVGDGGRAAIKASLTRKLRNGMDIDANAEISPPRFSISITLDISHINHYVHRIE